MQLSKQQIDSLEGYLIEHGLELQEVREDVLDHLCCIVEESLAEGKDFEAALSEAKTQFPPKEINTIQTDTIYFLTFKNSIVMVKRIFLSAYFAAIFFAFAIGFKRFFTVFTDPHLAEMLSALFEVTSVSILCFVFLPLLFRYGYRRFTHTLLAEE